MGELDSGNGSVVLIGGGDTRKAIEMRVVPNSNIAMSDPALRGIAGGLDHYELKTTKRELAVMDEMVVRCRPVSGLVLAHRRDGCEA